MAYDYLIVININYTFVWVKVKDKNKNKIRKINRYIIIFTIIFTFNKCFYFSKSVGLKIKVGTSKINTV